MRVDRVRQAHPRGDAGRDRDRPVDPRRDDAVHLLRLREPLDAELVLGRDDRPPVGEPEAGRRRVAVDRDDEQPALARRREQPELRRPRP